MTTISPTSYIAPEDFRAMPLDFDLSAYTDTQLQSLLDRASSKANAIMRQNKLYHRATVRFHGNGRTSLSLHRYPLIYVERVQFAFPNQAAYSLPIGSFLIDYERAEILDFAPIQLLGLGYITSFPSAVPIDVVLGCGYGYGPIAQPSFTLTDLATAYGGVIPAAYDVGVTARTPWGETLPTIVTYTTGTGQFQVTIAPVLGASSYGVYLAPQGQALTLVAEAAPPLAVNAPIFAIVNGLGPPTNTFPEPVPTVDTSARTTPNEIIEAVRLLALGEIYENNNLSNRGIAGTSSGKKSVRWRSTEGGSGRGIPLFFEQAENWLQPHTMAEIY